jgi:hypothetical protein
MKLSLTSLLPGSDRGWKSTYSVCAFEDCQNTRLMRSVQSRGGISMGGRWYCSTECFAVAARTRLAALAADNTIGLRHNPRLSIGLVMLSKGTLTGDQLRTAMNESKARREELEATLLRIGFATERQITAARAAQWGYPILGQEHVGRAVTADIPPALLRICAAVPLHFSAGARRFLLGFVHRVEHSLLNSIETVTGFRSDPCFITPTEYREQMARVTTASDCEEIVFSDAMSAAHMAKNLGGFAVEIAAHEARLVRCRDYAWARLFGKERKIDVIFRIASVVEAPSPRFPTRSSAVPA